MANYTISEMRKDLVAIHEDSRKAFVSRNEVLDTLEKFSGSYEALVKFAQECTPVEEGEFEEHECDRCSQVQSNCTCVYD